MDRPTRMDTALIQRKHICTDPRATARRKLRLCGASLPSSALRRQLAIRPHVSEPNYWPVYFDVIEGLRDLLHTVGPAAISHSLGEGAEAGEGAEGGGEGGEEE